MKSVKQLPQNSPVIIVTDSGLGGLSVLASLERLIKELNLFCNPKLVFFNAFGGENFGYNQIKELNKKLGQFDNALQAMIKGYMPDLILIACNTLSVIYSMTETYRTTSVAVEGIVEFGVDLFYGKLAKDENSVIILYGTPTTINSDVYRQKLIEKGISEARIINQPCNYLESEIQLNPSGEIVTEQIKRFTAEAVSNVAFKTNADTKYLGALCCTHYGYSIDAFESVMSEKFNRYEALNPNKLMSDYIELLGKPCPRQSSAEVSIVSRVEIPVGQIKSIGELLKPVSQKTYEALINYKMIPQLFELIEE